MIRNGARKGTRGNGSRGVSRIFFSAIAVSLCGGLVWNVRFGSTYYRNFGDEVFLPPFVSNHTMLEATSSRNFEKQESANTRKTVVLMTDYGWNSPDPAIARKRYRSMRSKVLFEAVRRLPYFDGELWGKVEEQTNNTTITPSGLLDPDTYYVIFFDMETCVEKNWPYYGRQSMNHDHSQRIKTFPGLPKVCKFIDTALDTMERNFAGYHATLLLLNCFGEGPRLCMMRNRTVWESQAERENERQSLFALASLSARYHDHIAEFDQGLPPPAIANFTLSSQEREHLCEERPYLLFFAGNFRAKVRKSIKLFHNESAGIITLPDHVKMRQGGAELFGSMLKKSLFGAVPRGDNVYSYRFTEVLAAGAIPVVYSDDWVLPFRSQVVNWEECCVVRIDEDNVNDTLSILSNISPQRRCEMQTNALRAYEEYIKEPDGVIAGLIKGLEASAAPKMTVRGTHPLPP